MRDLVRAYIKKYQLLTSDKPVLVAVSGGADSVALLSVLVELGYSCYVAHCNFHLRGEESMRDEQFVRELAERLHLPFLHIDFDTAKYAADNHISIEMAARELRYKWFDEQSSAIGAQAIAVAHHQDDNVETLLLNLTRGTGLRGLTGMKPKNGQVVRPLLGVSKVEIVHWLESRGLAYVTDSTNLSDDYRRNYIRLHVLPALESLNPSVKESIARTMMHLTDVETLYQWTLEQARQKVMQDENKISIPALLALPAPQTVLYELLQPFQFTPLVVNEIYESLPRVSGKTFFSPTHRLVKDRDCLLIRSLVVNTDDKSYLIPKTEGCWSGPVSLVFEKIPIDNWVLSKDTNCAYFDLDKISFPLTLRHWKKGDWFVPFGMKGRKKLSDYFSDEKYDLLDKEDVWLLCNGPDIIWIVGARSDNRYRVNEQTKNVLSVKISL